MNRYASILLAACAAFAPSAGPAFAAAPPAAPEWRRVEVEGTSLACIERGEGETIVLVHGSLGDLRSWEPQLKSLSREFRVIAYSRRHHHPNPAPEPGGEYSIARDVRDLAELMRLLDIPAAHLVGQGRGAEVCARFAIEHPQSVRSLVLSEPSFPRLIAGTDEGGRYVSLRGETRLRVKYALRDGFPDVAVRAYFDATQGDLRIESLPDSVLGRARANLEPLKLEMTSPADDFDCAAAKGIAAPVLVVNGGRSPASHRSIAAAFAACRPGTEREVFDRAAHEVPREAAGGFTKAVAKFVSAHAGPAAPVAGEP